MGNSNISRVLIPFLSKSGLYGYCDAQKKICIAPVYKSAILFTSTGYGVVENQQGLFGVIDSSNCVVVPFEYVSIKLMVVGKFTLLSCVKHFFIHTRFWQWKWQTKDSHNKDQSKFALFDTQTPRQRQQISVLETKVVLKVNTTTLDSKQSMGILDTKVLLKLRAICPGFVAVGLNLYKAKNNKVAKVLSAYHAHYDQGVKFMGYTKKGFVRVYDSKGKKGRRYEELKNGVFPISFNSKEYVIRMRTQESSFDQKAVIYRDTKSFENYYVNGVFDMPIPRYITKVEIDASINIVDLAKNIINILVLPQLRLFVIEVKVMVNGLSSSAYYGVSCLGVLSTLSKEVEGAILKSQYTGVFSPIFSTIMPVQKIPTDSKLVELHQIGQQVSGLYLVQLQKQDQALYGIYNQTQDKWIVPYEYSFLRVIQHGDYAIFKRPNSDKYGLLKVSDHQVVIQDFVDEFTVVNQNLMQVLSSSKSQDKVFYYDFLQGVEYHEHHALLG